MKARVRPRVAEGRLELHARRHQRLGDEASAEVAEAPGRTRVAHLAAPSAAPIVGTVTGIVLDQVAAGRSRQRADGVDERPHLPRVLDAGRRLDPTGHVDAEGVEPLDGHVDVARRRARPRR